MSGKGEWHRDEPFGGQQVRPDQTKAAKGQSGKKLVTAGTIKGPLPCPEKESKNRGYSRSKRKQSKRKQEKEKKKIRKKTEEKREEIEEKREIIQWACTNRSIPLSPPSNPALFQNITRILFGH